MFLEISGLQQERDNNAVISVQHGEPLGNVLAIIGSRSHDCIRYFLSVHAPRQEPII